MPRLSIQPLLAAVLALALYACGSARTTLRLYQHDTGDIVNMRVGETMEVVLEGDPTIDVTRIDRPDNPDILEQVGGPDYFTDLTTPDARGRLLLRFRATGAGRTRLQLRYKDIYRSNTARDEVFEVWVVVKR